MCGICGIVSAQSEAPVDARTLAGMCAALAHRGPDDEGVFISDRVGLAMRRLSIIDVQGGQQPLSNEDGTIHVVYNGEIYNYRQLRAELERLGHRFATASDTEVIVHAYEEFGPSCVHRFRGMFALALWDAPSRRLFVAVDRLGIKPLYYAARNGQLTFASELGSLLVSGHVPRVLDHGALAEYFTLGYIAAPRTILEDVRKLEPGTFGIWDEAGQLKVTRYWDLPESRSNGRPSSGTLRTDLRSALRDAVASHLVSDVPLGAFLSGGIDSSAIVALMSEVSDAQVKTFSIGFKDVEHNELDAARTVARLFRTDHHEVVVEPESVDVLPKLVSHFHEPFADSSALPTYYVSKIAREHVKVALSGDGGDELFVGYTTYLGVELARYAQMLPGLVRRLPEQVLRAFPSTSNPAWNDRVHQLRKRLADTALRPEEAFRSKITMIGLAGVGPLLSPELNASLHERDAFRAVNDALTSHSLRPRSHPLAEFLYASAKVSLPGDMLVKVDRMSMANSLEVRVPLLDHVLVEHVSALPVDLRFPRWRLKGLLKDVMADVLPSSILNRPKHGFTVPITNWFRGDLASFAREVLLDDSVRKRGLVDARAIENALATHEGGTRNLSSVLWALLIFELWCRQTLGD
jgi:asparagine synthase (glutamine-hydrolysing)